MHLPEQFAAFLESICSNHCHWVVVAVGSEVNLLLFVGLDDLFSDFSDLMIQSKEISGEALPWKDPTWVDATEFAH